MIAPAFVRWLALVTIYVYRATSDGEELPGDRGYRAGIGSSYSGTAAARLVSDPIVGESAVGSIRGR